MSTTSSTDAGGPRGFWAEGVERRRLNVDLMSTPGVPEDGPEGSTKGRGLPEDFGLEGVDKRRLIMSTKRRRLMQGVPGDFGWAGNVD
jgi:hypothetical protein